MRGWSSSVALALFLAGCTAPEMASRTTDSYSPAPTCATVMCDSVECDPAPVPTRAEVLVNITMGTVGSSGHRPPELSEFCWELHDDELGRWQQGAPARFDLPHAGNFTLSAQAPIDDGRICRWFINEPFVFDGQTPIEVVADYNALCT